MASWPCASKVLSTFVWPVYSAFRLLLIEKGDGALGFRSDPIALFDDMKSTLVAGVQSFHQNQAHGVVAQLGKDKEGLAPPTGRDREGARGASAARNLQR